MLRSPFTFLRGSAALMADDLATTPKTDLIVQVCGDCHLLNFGFFATPERNLVFDINDFDETLPAPWEWDLKRLVVSFVIAGRDSDLSDRESKGTGYSIALVPIENTCGNILASSPSEVWYTRIGAEQAIEMAPDKKAAEDSGNGINGQSPRAHHRTSLPPRSSPKLADAIALSISRLILYHVNEPDWETIVCEGLEDYRQSPAGGTPSPL
jgi:hypothetical protein